jgi:prolyl oligopeptidase
MFSYPEAHRSDIVDLVHGQPVADPYRWLEDAGTPATEAWSVAQDALYESVRATWPGREEFHARLSTLHAVGDVETPVWRGDRGFVGRREPHQDHSVLHVISADGTMRALVDLMAIDPSGTTTLDFAVPSPDGARLAYGLSEGGTEKSLVRVLDVTTGEVIEGPIDRIRHSPIAWLPDGSGYYYVRHLPFGSVGDDDAELHRRVYAHTVGTDPDRDDVLVFGEGLPRVTYFDVDISPDGRWLAIVVRRGTDARNDLWLADRESGGGFVPIQLDVDAHSYLEFRRDGLAYIFTNRDAPHWRLCVADPAALYAGAGYHGWRDAIAEDPEAVLVTYVVLDGDEMPEPRYIALRTRHAIGEVTVHDPATGAVVDKVALPGVGTVTGLSERRDGGHEAWFGYTDFTTPNRILRYDAVSGGLDVWAEPPGTAAPRVDVVTQHVFYPSYDGTEVGLFVAASGGAPATPAPAVLYGYGGFNISRPPVYDPWIVAWIEAGGVFALASLRGGSEEGEGWHRAGMRESKQNVFDDFAAAADWLVANGWTTHDALGIFGGSNGGLLVGAALTRHPEKYAAVVFSAPLLDMLRYERFGLGANWNGEYGTVDDPTEFGWLYAYSPYHRVRDGVAYPAVMFTVFEGDSRVDPLHARKLCAALQHATSGTAPVLIRREIGVGHAGRAVSRTVDLAAG